MNAPPQRNDRDDPIVEPLGPGPRLRAARERIDMSLEEIGERLHLHTSTIEALETNAYALLPAPTFVRGYLRGYARLVGLAPEPVVDEFDSQGLAPPALVADISEGPQARTSDLPMRLATWAILAALVILVVMWWKSQSTGLDFSSSATGEESVEAQAAAPAEPPTAAAMPGSVAPAVTAGTAPDEDTGAAADPADTGAMDAARAEAPPGPRPEPATGELAFSGTGDTPPVGDGADGIDHAALVQAAEETAETAAAPAAAPAAASAMAPGEAAPPPTAAQAAAQVGSRVADTDAEAGTGPDAGTSIAETAQSALDDAPVAPPDSPTVAAAPVLSAQASAPPAARAEGEERLELRFDAESWVEIYDRDEQRLYFNLVQPGAEIAVAGPGPLRVLLGRAEGVVATHNGAPLDVAPFIVKGIARFSVGASAPTQ